MKKIYFILLFAAPIVASAQDTSGVVTIRSAYKPVIKNSVKLNFTATPVIIDTVRKVERYNIPDKGLVFSYVPVAMKPLDVNKDTSVWLGNRRYVKAGFGNYSTPYLDAGYGMGDGKTSLLNINAFYTSSKGKEANQDYSNFSLKGSGSYYLPANEVYGQLGYRANKHYLYNIYLPPVNKENIPQNLQDFFLGIGIRNTKPNEVGINYDASLNANFVSLMDKMSETNLRFLLPANKKINEKFTASLQILADISRVSNKTLSVSFSNNILALQPAVNYTGKDLKIKAGINPVWDQGEARLLPDLFAEIHPEGKNFTVLAGLKGEVVKNSLNSISRTNPYFNPYPSIENTTQTELFGGIRTTFAKYFQFNARVGLVRMKDVLLYAQPFDLGFPYRGFDVLNESKMGNFRISSELSYTMPEKISATAGVTFNGYSGQKTFDRPYGLIPLEMRASVNYLYNEKLGLKANLYYFEGTPYWNGGGSQLLKTKGGADLSLGAEYKINNKFSAWLDGNNLFGNKYQVYRGYPVIGANLVGGIIVRF